MPVETRAYLSIYGADPETVTATLGILLAKSAREGSLLRSGLVRDSGSWEIRRSCTGEDIDLTNTLMPMLSDVLPRWRTLLVKAAPKHVEIEIAVYGDGGPDEPSQSILFESELLAQLNELQPLSMQISLY